MKRPGNSTETDAPKEFKKIVTRDDSDANSLKSTHTATMKDLFMVLFEQGKREFLAFVNSTKPPHGYFVVNKGISEHYGFYFCFARVGTDRGPGSKWTFLFTVNKKIDDSEPVFFQTECFAHEIFKVEFDFEKIEQRMLGAIGGKVKESDVIATYECELTKSSWN